MQGHTLKESVRDDFVLTLAEDEKPAKLFLAYGALAKRDPVLEFSRIRVEPALDRPADLHELSLEFTGIPLNQPLLQGKGQQATRRADGKVVFTMPNPAYAPPSDEAPAAADLESSVAIPRDHPVIIAKKDLIVGTVKDQSQVARLLEEWVAKEIKGTESDGQSPLDTLKSGNGDCQSHTRLYAALARAARIPTRIVSGLVYLPGQGFLYHSWAESYIGGWLTVDPALGVMPVDLTHIKFVQGDTPEDMVLLAGMIGRIKAVILSKKW